MLSNKIAKDESIRRLTYKRKYPIQQSINCHFLQTTVNPGSKALGGRECGVLMIIFGFFKIKTAHIAFTKKASAAIVFYSAFKSTHRTIPPLLNAERTTPSARWR